MKKSVNIDIILTPDEVAQFFCDMDQDEQAEFFNHIYDISSKWKFSFDFQLHGITNSDVLKRSGRNIMRSIGEYAERN